MAGRGWPAVGAIVSRLAGNKHWAVGYIESAEQSRTTEQNKISKLTVKLKIT